MYQIAISAGSAAIVPVVEVSTLTLPPRETSVVTIVLRSAVTLGSADLVAGSLWWPGWSAAPRHYGRRPGKF